MVINFIAILYFIKFASAKYSFYFSALHKISFIMFLLMSLMHMSLAYIIARNCRNVSKDIHDSISLKWKFNSMVLNVTAILLAVYFFYRHNKYCEPFGKNHFHGFIFY